MPKQSEITPEMKHKAYVRENYQNVQHIIESDPSTKAVFDNYDWAHKAKVVRRLIARGRK